MSRIGSTLAAALVASPLFMAAPGQTETNPAPETRQLTETVLGCKLYSNTLKLMSEKHLHGSLVLTPQQLALAGAEGILVAGHQQIVSHTPPGEESGSKLDGPDDEKIKSWTLKGKTIEAGAPPDTIRTNVDACAYLSGIAVQVSEASGVPAYDLFEAATARATFKAIPEDTHSFYEPRTQTQETSQQMRGEFGGVGMEISKVPGKALIAEKIMRDSPSAKAGLVVGDNITHIDGKSVLSLNSQETVDLLRGPRGTQVRLTVQRGEGTPFVAEVTRDLIVQRAVEGFLLKGTETGVISISNFSNEKATDQLLETAVEIAKKAHEEGKKIRHFVIRVDNNPGGLLDQGIMISDLIVDSDADLLRRIVSTGKSSTELGMSTFADRAMPYNLTQYVNSKLPPEAQIEELAVTVTQNGGSASASEIFAGAAQDAGFPVVGTRSYGKGTVQQITPLKKDGTVARRMSEVYGSLRLTVEAFFPGSGPGVRPIAAGGIPMRSSYIPAISSVGKSNLGSGIVPDVLVRTGDGRDADEQNRPKEQPGLLDVGQTRAGDKPKLVCTVRPEFRGELSPETRVKIPEQLVISYAKRDHLSGEWKRAKMLDANLACAAELYYDAELSLVELGSYQELESAPVPVPVPAPAP